MVAREGEGRWDEIHGGPLSADGNRTAVRCVCRVCHRLCNAGAMDKTSARPRRRPRSKSRFESKSKKVQVKVMVKVGIDIQIKIKVKIEVEIEVKMGVKIKIKTKLKIEQLQVDVVCHILGVGVEMANLRRSRSGILGPLCTSHLRHGSQMFALDARQ